MKLNEGCLPALVVTTFGENYITQLLLLPVLLYYVIHNTFTVSSPQSLVISEGSITGLYLRRIYDIYQLTLVIKRHLIDTSQ